MHASIISFRFGIRCDGSDMVRLGFWNSRVSKGKIREIGLRKLRGLMVYDKGGLIVFKFFLFINQLFCCAFIKCCDNK